MIHDPVSDWTALSESKLSNESLNHESSKASILEMYSCQCPVTPVKWLYNQIYFRLYTLETAPNIHKRITWYV